MTKIPGGIFHAAAALRRWLDLSDTAKDLLMGMLEYDPKKRLTAKEVLVSCHSFCWLCSPASKAGNASSCDLPL